MDRDPEAADGRKPQTGGDAFSTAVKGTGGHGGPRPAQRHEWLPRADVHRRRRRFIIHSHQPRRANGNSR